VLLGPPTTRLTTHRVNTRIVPKGADGMIDDDFDHT
jgi:hypothetical protein